MMGAAIATVAAYIAHVRRAWRWWSQRIYPVAVPVAPRAQRPPPPASRSSCVGKLAGGGLPVAILLALVYPLALLPLGFYLPSERRAIGARIRLAR